MAQTLPLHATMVPQTSCDKYPGGRLSCGGRRTLPKIKKGEDSKVVTSFEPRARSYLVRIEDMNIASLNTAPQTTAGTQNTSPRAQGKNYFRIESVLSDRANRRLRLAENNRMATDLLQARTTTPGLVSTNHGQKLFFGPI